MTTVRRTRGLTILEGGNTKSLLYPLSDKRRKQKIKGTGRPHDGGANVLTVRKRLRQNAAFSNSFLPFRRAQPQLLATSTVTSVHITSLRFSVSSSNSSLTSLVRLIISSSHLHLQRSILILTRQKDLEARNESDPRPFLARPDYCTRCV
jgi:hypothetical protein